MKQIKNRPIGCQVNPSRKRKLGPSIFNWLNIWYISLVELKFNCRPQLNIERQLPHSFSPKMSNEFAATLVFRSENLEKDATLVLAFDDHSEVAIKGIFKDVFPTVVK